MERRASLRLPFSLYNTSPFQYKKCTQLMQDFLPSKNRISTLDMITQLIEKLLAVRLREEELSGGAQSMDISTRLIRIRSYITFSLTIETAGLWFDYFIHNAFVWTQTRTSVTSLERPSRDCSIHTMMHVELLLQTERNLVRYFTVAVFATQIGVCRWRQWKGPYSNAKMTIPLFL